MLLLALVLVFLIIAWYEVPALLREQLYSELLVFALLMVLAFSLSCLQTLGVTLPNPVRGLERLSEVVITMIGGDAPRDRPEAYASDSTLTCASDCAGFGESR